MSFKLPVSVLVVIYAEDTKRVLMLQRRDDPAFWQSVTGSLEEGETALHTCNFNTTSCQCTDCCFST